ncbi:hypothetical protein C8R44DRAFT_876196 [Mycena epipterygia]|nr:hypothetical protein C8R44DRAFT_876196 [Mycena epipterygia]
MPEHASNCSPRYWDSVAPTRVNKSLVAGLQQHKRSRFPATPPLEARLVCASKGGTDMGLASADAEVLEYTPHHNGAHREGFTAAEARGTGIPLHIDVSLIIACDPRSQPVSDDGPTPCRVLSDFIRMHAECLKGCNPLFHLYNCPFKYWDFAGNFRRPRHATRFHTIQHASKR